MAEPLFDDSFGYALAMRVLQSDLYKQLDDKERAECDELIARGQTPSKSDADWQRYNNYLDRIL